MLLYGKVKLLLSDHHQYQSTNERCRSVWKSDLVDVHMQLYFKSAQNVQFIHDDVHMYKFMNSFFVLRNATIHMKDNLPLHCSKCKGKNLSDISSYLLKLNQRYSDRRGCKNTVTYPHKIKPKHFQLATSNHCLHVSTNRVYI